MMSIFMTNASFLHLIQIFLMVFKHYFKANGCNCQSSVSEGKEIADDGFFILLYLTPNQ